MKSAAMILMMSAVLVVGPAFADDENLVYEQPAGEVRVEGWKSPGTATGLSVGGFLFPVALTVALATVSADGGGDSGSAGASLLRLSGTIFGPGLGHAYAGNSGQFWKGAGLRTLSWGGFLAAVAMSWDNPDAGGAAAIAVGSGVIYLVSSIHDMVTAGDAARRHNEKLAAPEISVTPIWTPKDRSVGLRVALGF